MAIILSNLTDFRSVFTGRFLGKFAASWLLKILPFFAYVATLLCEILISINKRFTINCMVV